MNLYTSLTILCLWSMALQAQVNFLDISLNEATALAEQEDKLVFVDVYTTWCGPCKKMDHTTFQDSAVAMLMDAKYISLKWDAESEQHQDQVRLHEVDSYPSYLIFDSSGQMVAKLSGYSAASAFKKKVDGISTHVSRLTSYNDEADFSSMVFSEMHELLLSTRGLSYEWKESLFDQYFENLAEDESIGWDTLTILIDHFSKERLSLFDRIVSHIDPISPMQKGFMEKMEVFSPISQVLRQTISAAKEAGDKRQLVLAFSYRTALEDALFGKETQLKSVKVNRADLLDFYRINKQKDAYAALSDTMVSEYILPYPPERIKKQDEYSRKFLSKMAKTMNEVVVPTETPRDSLTHNYISACQAGERLYQISETFLDFFEDQDRLEKAASWAVLATEFCPLPEYYLNHAKLLYKLDDLATAQEQISKASDSNYLTPEIAKSIDEFQSMHKSN